VAWYVALLLLALGLLAGPAAAVPAIELHDRQDSADVTGHLEVLVDPAGQMDLAAVRQAATDGRFAPVTRMPPTFGFADGVFWFHLSVENRDHPEPDWVIAIAYALLDRVRLHTVHPDGQVSEQESGDLSPFTTRTVVHRQPTFAVNLMRGERADLFLRVSSQSSIQVPIELMTVQAFLERAPLEHLGLGLYYGILLGLFFYNLILFASTGDRTFLYYVLYVGSFALGQFCLNGLAFQFLWPNSPEWANTAVLVSIGTGLVFMLVFTRAFLELAKNFPAADRAVQGVILVLLATQAAIAVLGYRRIILLETGLVFVIALLILVAAIKVWRDGYRPARNFLIAWSALLIGVVVYAAVSFGLLPKMFVTEYGIQIGSAAEMILLSFALAYRINTLREENVRIQNDAREQLESRVEERTHELGEAMQRLRRANELLAEFSLRDGLTGAWNRRWLDHHLAQVWEGACARGEPLSLLMVDIDHFKSINDRFGHLVGDDCLRAVADCLASKVEGGRERVVRYGGEEFFVLLPGAGDGAALQAAEGVRAAVADRRVHSEGVGLNLTVSVGVATFRPHEHLRRDDLVRITDQAMYAAKRDGRNRVCVRDPATPAPGDLLRRRTTEPQQP
jgi:diguanylate cyclase (GGDEF)-like protein